MGIKQRKFHSVVTKPRSEFKIVKDIVKRENMQSISWKDHWLFYVIMTVGMAFVGIAFGKLTIGFIISMILMLLSGVYPAFSEGVVEIITHNACFVMIFLLLEIYVHKREKKSIRELWLAGSKHQWKEFLSGAAIGFLMCTLSVMAAALLTDWELSFQSVDIVVIGLVFISCVIQATIEEILFRGYLLNGLRKSYSVGFCIVLSGVAFSVTHIMNPGITILAIINITLFGIVLSFLAVKWNSLFPVIGIHLMWNFSEEIIFGTPNSGLVFPKSIFALVGGGASVFYNQDFGIESSVQTMLLLCMLLVSSWRLRCDR